MQRRRRECCRLQVVAAFAQRLARARHMSCDVTRAALDQKTTLISLVSLHLNPNEHQQQPYMASFSDIQVGCLLEYSPLDVPKSLIHLASHSQQLSSV